MICAHKDTRSQPYSSRNPSQRFRCIPDPDVTNLLASCHPWTAVLVHSAGMMVENGSAHIDIAGQLLEKDRES
jgi:hypothetical protein